MFLVKRAYFNKTYIIKGFILALFFSAFIYLEHFNFQERMTNTVLGLVCLYLLLKIEKNALFYSGFFVGVLWFYWIAISFQYYDLLYLFPLIILGIGIIYGILFYLIALYDHIVFRIFIISLLSFIQPFGFNWFIPELIFINSYFPTSKEYFVLILALVYLFIRLNKKLKILAFIPLFFIYENPSNQDNNLSLNIAMPQLNISQVSKWLKNNKISTIDKNLQLIDKAIKEKKDLIILPETVFPVLLNKENFLLANLLEKSKKIDILAGALYKEDNHFYNASYHFSKQNVKVAKKLVLVPFGEEIPLPKYFVDLINNIFYNGAQDYKKAEKPTDFLINNIKFRNAICYEATKDEIYKDLNNTKYMIAISNNAWFTPSIQPSLQKLLLKYYAKKYDIIIFHSINGSPNYIIKP